MKTATDMSTSQVDKGRVIKVSLTKAEKQLMQRYRNDASLCRKYLFTTSINTF